jgi:hypothetical protein
MEDLQSEETFQDFIKSFFYGSRSDLSFKFMSDLSEENASRFLTALFHDVIDAIDENDLGRIKKRILDGQIQGYRHQKNFDYDDGPFAAVSGPVASLKLTLITSSGHFLKNQDPNPLGVANMTQQEAEKRVFDFLKEEPQLSQIPFSSLPDQLRVRHGGYDIRAAEKDPNVSFPYEAMTRLNKEGLIGSLTDNAYSFVGACSQKRLLKKTLPGWVEKFRQEGVQAAVLVPV